MNRLLWSMTQGWLLGTLKDVQQDFLSLAAVARKLVSPSGRDAVEKTITEQSEVWKRLFDSEWRADEIAQTEHDPIAWDTRDQRDDVCTTLLETVSDIHRALRAYLRALMDPTCLLAFELGERIDQVLRPEHVYRYMYRPCQLEPGQELSWGGPSGPPSTDQMWPEENRVANHRVKPGEISLDFECAQKICQIWEELELPNTLPADLTAALEGQEVKNVAGLHRDLRRQAREELRGLRARRPVPRWDKSQDPYQLVFQGVVIREVRPLAGNLIAILDAFESAAWEPTIRSPLSDPQTLHQTLRQLRQGLCGITFHASAGGRQVTWRPDSAE